MTKPAMSKFTPIHEEAIPYTNRNDYDRDLAEAYPMCMSRSSVMTEMRVVGEHLVAEWDHISHTGKIYVLDELSNDKLGNYHRAAMHQTLAGKKNRMSGEGESLVKPQAVPATDGKAQELSEAQEPRRFIAWGKDISKAISVVSRDEEAVRSYAADHFKISSFGVNVLDAALKTQMGQYGVPKKLWERGDDIVLAEGEQVMRESAADTLLAALNESKSPKSLNTSGLQAVLKDAGVPATVVDSAYAGCDADICHYFAVVESGDLFGVIGIRLMAMGGDISVLSFDTNASSVSEDKAAASEAMASAAKKPLVESERRADSELIEAIETLDEATQWEKVQSWLDDEAKAGKTYDPSVRGSRADFIRGLATAGITTSEMSAGEHWKKYVAKGGSTAQKSHPHPPK